MKFNKILIKKLFFIFISSQLLFNITKASAAEEIKIIYSIFSRTIKVDSLKTYAQEGKSTKKLKRILKATGSSDKEIQEKIKNIGWHSVVIWECETKNIDDLREKLIDFI